MSPEEATPASRPRRGRWAPSPTGPLHVGSARTALAAWLSVRRGGGELVYRIEDLDPPRTVEGAAEQQLDDLAWLGLDWDEGSLPAGSERGSHRPYRQSQRSDLYRQALLRLAAVERIFPCRLSRKDLQGLASAPHSVLPGSDSGSDTGGGPPAYPARLRPRTVESGWLERLLASAPNRDAGAAVRFRVDPGPVAFDDRVRGPVVQRVDESVGDFVLRRRDGLWAYQLAVVVDDLMMGIGEVVRGDELLPSTGRQIQLARALGGAAPEYAHVPVVTNAAGAKLSKRDGGAALGELRRVGVAPERLVGYLAFSLGLIDRDQPASPDELVAHFAWERIRREPWRLPNDWPAPLLGAGG